MVVIAYASRAFALFKMLQCRVVEIELADPLRHRFSITPRCRFNVFGYACLMPSIEDQIRDFYESDGWVADESGNLGEDRQHRHRAANRAAYDERESRRSAELFRDLEGTLLIAGGGDLPDAHRLVAQPFDRLECIDISQRALEIQRSKLGERGNYHQASMLALPLADQAVDAAFCAHALYHVDESNQEQAVRELIRVTRSGGRVAIVYGNPDAPSNRAQRMIRAMLWKLRGPRPNRLYHYTHPLRWWDRFSDTCEVRVLPWSVLHTQHARLVIPPGWLGRQCYRGATWLEDRHPERAVKLWAYPIILLTRR